MKNYHLTIFLLLSFSLSFAQTNDSLSIKEQERREANIQAGNPFKRFGYKPKIHTLSKGKYLEFHDLDSIVKIGSFSFHVRKKLITGFTEKSNEYSEATLRPEIVSRWFSPDPLAKEFPSWSPYNFVNDNPLRYTDPTGLAPEDIILNKDLTKEQRTEIISNLQKLTDDKLSYNSETNRIDITSFNNDGNKKGGTGLIRTLVGHDKDVTIGVSQAGFMAGEEGTIEADIPDGINTRNGVGTNAEVTFGSYNRKFLTENTETQEIGLETQPSFVALGHELIHANAIMDGNSSNRDWNRTYNDGNGPVTERHGIEEYRTVGFSGWQRMRGNYTTENQIRKENQLGRRVSYGNKRYKKKN